jgi:hypothetical protein
MYSEFFGVTGLHGLQESSDTPLCTQTGEVHVIVTQHNYDCRALFTAVSELSQ